VLLIWAVPLVANELQAERLTADTEAQSFSYASGRAAQYLSAEQVKHVISRKFLFNLIHFGSLNLDRVWVLIFLHYQDKIYYLQ